MAVENNDSEHVGNHLDNYTTTTHTLLYSTLIDTFHMDCSNLYNQPLEIAESMLGMLLYSIENRTQASAIVAATRLRPPARENAVAPVGVSISGLAFPDNSTSTSSMLFYSSTNIHHSFIHPLEVYISICIREGIVDGG